jgi:hypothetical protein
MNQNKLGGNIKNFMWSSINNSVWGCIHLQIGERCEFLTRNLIMSSVWQIGCVNVNNSVYEEVIK